MSYRAYVEHGWKICRIKEREKGPNYRNWNHPKKAIPAEQAEHLSGAGLMHAYSGTMAFDIDNLDLSRAYLAKLNIDVDALLQAPDAVRIVSGRQGSDKLLYALPTPLPTKKVLTDQQVTMFELRCADSRGELSLQDVLPPSVHPSGRRYEWRYGDELCGDWRNLPPLPEALRELWMRLLGPTQPIVQTVPRETLTPRTAPHEGVAAEIQSYMDEAGPDCDYDSWIKLGQLAQTELGDAGWDLWDAWSSTGTKYPGANQLDTHWRSFGKHPNPITLGSYRQGRVSLAKDFEDLGEVPESDPFDNRAERVAALKLWTLPEIQQRPWPTWIVQDLLPQAELSMIYGASGAGKSFVVLDMALAIAQGKEWWGHQTRKGGVLWLAAEAFGSMKPRTKAYSQANDVELSTIENFYTVEQFNLNSPETVETLIEAVKGKQLTLVVVDTLAAASGGANENTGEDMGKILDACRAIHYATRASVALIHHSGKNAELGARGWSGIRAAVQAELRVDYDPERSLRSLTSTKQRDGIDGICYGFTLNTVTVGMDERDTIIESAYVKCTGKLEVEKVQGDGGGKRPPKGVNESLMWKQFLEMAPLDGGPVSRSALIEAVARTVGNTEDMPKTRRNLDRALIKLHEQQYINLAGELVHPQNAIDAVSEGLEDLL